MTRHKPLAADWQSGDPEYSALASEDGDFLRPYVYQTPASIPPRQYPYGRHYQRKQVSATIAPPGAGKTSLGMAEGLAMATFRPLLGITPACRLRVGYWGEDSVEETHRRIAANILQFGLDGRELQEWLYVGSAREQSITLGESSHKGVVIDRAEVDRIERYVRAARLDVLIIDPFVASHQVAENDNGAMDAVAKAWVGIADRCNIAVELTHHPRKGPGGDHEVTVDDARGAGSLIAAVRSARMLNVMSEREAEKAGIEERHGYFRCTTGKANTSKRSSAQTWFQLVGVPLGNGVSGAAGDEVAVVIPWKPPNPFAGISAAQVLQVQERIAAGEWRGNNQANDWVGYAVAEVMGLPTAEKKDKARIVEMLRTWTANGLLGTERRKDKHGDERPFIVVGKWMTP